MRRQHQPMLALKLSRVEVAARISELTNLAEMVEYIRSIKGNRIAGDLLVNGIGLTLDPQCDENYYREALDYQLGLLYAFLKRPEQAAEYFRRSAVLPFSGGNLVFSDSVTDSLDLHQQQLGAAARGMPSILIASMPRSASASLTQSISATLGVPVLRLSAGDFPDYVLVPRWLDILSLGGAVTHDHFGASPFNLKVLANAGWRDVFVLARDPRASSASSFNLGETMQGQSGNTAEQSIIETALSCFIPWLNEWAEAEVPGLRVHWLRSKDVTSNMDSVIQRMMQTLLPGGPALASFLDAPVQEIKANFVVGDDDAWRQHVGPADRQRLWDTISAKAKERMNLTP